MFIGINIILAVCAVGFLCAGIRLWRRSGRSKQESLTVFAERRNAVSCFCLTALCVVIGVCINL